MNKMLLYGLFMLMCMNTAVFAREGYRIDIKFKNTQDTMAYLVHYYAKPLPTIYKSDSAKIDKNGRALFDNKDTIVGGIYMILLSDKKTYFEFLLNNGDNMRIEADAKHLPESLVFKGSDENTRFQQYVNYLSGFSKKQQALEAEIAQAKTASDTATVREKAKEYNKELTDYRRNYANKYPNTLLASIFHALEVPVVPEGKHYLPDGTEDSTFGYRYYKEHYWDGFDFHDDRLIHTPIYDAKLEEYINRLVPPFEDSVMKEADMLLAKTRGRKELFKYTLYWLTRNAESSKIMGMDRVFVYLVENYYMRGDAYWLDNEALNKYYDAAAKKTPNLIGRVAPEIIMQDREGVEHKLSDFNAKYTLIVFWDPTCGHCIQEVPKIDSLYRAVLKKKGVRIIGIRTEGPEEGWDDFVAKHHLDDWLHLYDPEHHSDYRAKYDVYSTPIIYLLDERKIIRGKRLDHTNIMDVINMIEKKESDKKK